MWDPGVRGLTSGPVRGSPPIPRLYIAFLSLRGRHPPRSASACAMQPTQLSELPVAGLHAPRGPPRSMGWARAVALTYRTQKPLHWVVLGQNPSNLQKKKEIGAKFKFGNLNLHPPNSKDLARNFKLNISKTKPRASNCPKVVLVLWRTSASPLQNRQFGGS